MINIDEINQLKQQANGNFEKLVKAYQAYGLSKFQTCASTAKTMYFDQEDNVVYDREDFFNFPIGKLNIGDFKQGLIDHQQGKTDFPTWLELTAGAGIGYWIVDLCDKTCVYYDLDNNPVYTEMINI